MSDHDEHRADESAHDDDATPVPREVAASPAPAAESPAPAPAAESPWWSASSKPLWAWLGLSSAPLWYRVGQVLLPPLLAAGALGVHWWLNVPERILESPKDQGAKQPDKKAPKGRAKRDRQASRQQEDARTPEQLEADWTNLAGGRFEDEPSRAGWARRHQALINRAMVIGRQQGFEGAPEEPRVVLASTKCRTVRCRFVMRSPYRHELDLMAAALRRVQVDDETIWRSFEIEPIEPPPGMPAGEHYAQVTVGFVHEDTDSRSLVLGPAPDDADDDDELADEEPPAADGDEANVARAEPGDGRRRTARSPQ